MSESTPLNPGNDVKGFAPVRESQPIHPPIPTKQKNSDTRRLTRRNVLKLTGATTLITTAEAAGVLTSKDVIDIPNPTDHLIAITENISDHFNNESESQNSAPSLFSNKETEKISDSLGLKPRDFIYPTEPLINNITALHDATDKLPIFHPAINDITDSVEAITKILDWDVNPNIPLMLASIKSGGNDTLPNGLFGVSQRMTDNYSEKYDQVYKDKFKDTAEANEVNIRYGLLAFKEKCDTAKEQLIEEGIIDEQTMDHPEVYVRAVRMYNYGDQSGTRPLEDQSESEKILTFTVRSFMKTLELAHKLRTNGMIDYEIQGHIQSAEVNSRMWAITNALGQNISLDDLLRYFSDDIVKKPTTYQTKIAHEEDVEFSATDELTDAYNNYQHMRDELSHTKVSGGLTHPLNPWLRFYHAVTETAQSHIKSFPKNANLNEWSDPNP